VQRTNRSKTAYRAGYKGTRNHHQATRTGRLETTPVRKPRVGQRAMPLSICHLYMYPRSLLGTIKGETREWTRQANKATQRSYTVELPYSIPRLYSPLYKHLGAKKYKLSPLLDVGPSLARTRINPCVFLHHHLRKGSTHTNSLGGVTPGGKTPTHLLEFNFCFKNIKIA